MKLPIATLDKNLRRVFLRPVELFLLGTAAVFFVFHVVHLRADFPNHSPWMDWAKYTDEGWYGDAAIRHFQRGNWYVPGDFNPAVALPVWPLVESFVFHFTGVNIEAARALAGGIFALILLCVYFLVRRWQRESGKEGWSSLSPATSVLLLAVSPFCYAFGRMAILEPMLILLTLLSLLAASYLPATESETRRVGPIMALGLLLPLMVLTKTTAIFLFPCIAWLVFARSGYRLRETQRVAVPILALAAAIWGTYYGLFVRPHFLSDYRYLFSANDYTGITSQNAFQVLCHTVHDGLWLGHILYPMALMAAVAALLIKPRLLRNPLLPALLLWAVGYASFIAYHGNLQPRYYLVIVVPVTLLTVIVFENFSATLRRPLAPVMGVVCATALTVVAMTDARRTLGYVCHPEYTFASAADRIHQIVASDHTHNSLVLSISGSDLSLMTGLPSICDDFGTMELADRVESYHPGWYVAWNQVDDDKMDALTPIYRLNRVASFPAMDDPERNLLILYRLDPIQTASHKQEHIRPSPRLVQTAFRQPNPSVQLQH